MDTSVGDRFPSPLDAPNPRVTSEKEDSSAIGGDSREELPRVVALFAPFLANASPPVEADAEVAFDRVIGPSSSPFEFELCRQPRFNPDVVACVWCSGSKLLYGATRDGLD